MDRYDQENYRRNSYGRDYENRNNRRNDNSEGKLQNYLSRYQEGGNYYGMPDNDYEYRNVRTSRGSDYGNNSSGPTQRSSSNQDAYQSGGRNSYGGSYDNRSDKYSSGRSEGNRNSGSQNDQYRYGDPNAHMNYNRNSGYERTRGTGWRSESDDSRRGSSDYARQNNSYQYEGSGKRYSDFGRDEKNNYGHNERLTDIHTDRGEHKHRRSDNDYSSQRSRQNDRDDNYATGMYSSNRAYLADQGQNRDKDMFDHTSDDYPNRSPRGYGRKSGPDWSADSPINRGYHTGADRG